MTLEPMLDWLLTLLRRPADAFRQFDGSLFGPSMAVLAYGTVSVGIAIPALAAVESRLPAVPEITFVTGQGEIAAPSVFVGVLAIVLGRDLPASFGAAPWYVDGSGLLDARTLLPALGTLWAGYVWLGALEVVHELSRRRALIVVGLMVLLLLPSGDPSVVVRS